MSFLKKVKEITGDIADSGKRGALRGKLELEVRRLEGKLNDEKNGIGQAVFPLLAAGTVAIADEAVAGHMTRIAVLSEELTAKRKEIDSLGEGDATESKPETTIAG